MKTRLLVALLSLSALSAFAQEVEVETEVPDLSATVQVPGASVQVRTGAASVRTTSVVTTTRAAPRPPPMQLIGVDTFQVSYEPNGRESLRLLSPVGAHADLWADDGSYLGGYELPCDVPARAGGFYRVVISQSGTLVFDGKVELRQFLRTTISMRGPRLPPPPPMMAMVDFPALLRAVKKEPFADGKLQVIRLSQGGLTCDQAGELLAQMSFSDDMLAALGLLKPRLVDRQNQFKLLSHLTFEDDKTKAAALLDQ